MCVSEEKLDRHKKYDIFLSYCHEDEELVLEELLSRLENGPEGYRVCFHTRGLLEFKYAHNHMLKENRNRVIIIVYGEIMPGIDLDKDLKAYLETNTYLMWGDPYFEKLHFVLPR